MNTQTNMKTKTNKTLGDEIVMQMRSTGSTYTITMTTDCDGCDTIILKDNDCGDITIIQEYGEGPKIMYFDEEQVKVMKAILQ